MNICQWCGKEITRKDKKKYCSVECYQLATRKRQSERRKMNPKREPKPLSVKKCKNCGKEFMQKTSYQEFCCGDCSLKYHAQKIKLRSHIRRMAAKFGFELKNLEKIVNAKMRFFDNGERLRCPCASQDPDHYCGSPRCIADTVYKGHCCCKLFWSKKEPLLKQYIENFGD